MLVDGLDRYFDGRYDDAIHLWTRVLFLDRAHSRARAYIDRARTALAEEQRRADEVLEASRDLLERGQTEAARDLLAEAVASSADDERASALRLRLERVERAHAPHSARRLPIVNAPQAIPAWSWKRRSPALIAAVLVAAGLLLILVASRSAVRDVMRLSATGDILSPSIVPAALPVLSISEAALVRARTLYGRGRLAEALQSLDRVDDGSAVRADADALKVEIQRLLLAGRRTDGVSPAGDPGIPR